MTKLIIESISSERKHKVHLSNLFQSSLGTVRVAVGYVTEETLLTDLEQNRKLLISLSLMDLVSGATSLEVLGRLILSGVECRFLPEHPRLHAKVYIFGTAHAVVTSANLTNNALNKNIEVGVELTTEQAQELIIWFDELWSGAAPLTLKYLSELQSKIGLLRDEYKELNRKLKIEMVKSGVDLTHTNTVQSLYGTAKHFFVCNSDRKQGDQNEKGFISEQAMFDRGFAAAWESFAYPSHMERVEKGDAVFMFAKGIGIIGVGVALGRCERLSTDGTDRLRNFDKEENYPEWRVPVKWLIRVEDTRAYRWKHPLNATFYDVTDQKYDDFRNEVKSHFKEVQ